MLDFLLPKKAMDQATRSLAIKVWTDFLEDAESKIRKAVEGLNPNDPTGVGLSVAPLREVPALLAALRATCHSSLHSPLDLGRFYEDTLAYAVRIVAAGSHTIDQDNWGYLREEDMHGGYRREDVEGLLNDLAEVAAGYEKKFDGYRRVLELADLKHKRNVIDEQIKELEEEILGQS